MSLRVINHVVEAEIEGVVQSHPTLIGYERDRLDAIVLDVGLLIDHTLTLGVVVVPLEQAAACIGMGLRKGSSIYAFGCLEFPVPAVNGETAPTLVLHAEYLSLLGVEDQQVA